MGKNQHEVGRALPSLPGRSVAGFFLADALRRFAGLVGCENHCPSYVQCLGNSFNLKHFGFGKVTLSEK